ncbi:adenylosuccinate synthase [Wolbachia endosymbiont of Pentidionis agamae]|uniref:adenylosuccinate synthase n=1 Tax=Wolbachia endosymbiont of Pentidionis agamae TaxID=3110435 RepID=UPI002FD3B829
MKNIVVIGLQWGDEGKGKIVDYLSGAADVVVRFQGGNNAGHTIVINNEVYKLNLLPSSILRENKISVIGNGVALDPYKLLSEIKSMQARGIDINPNNLMLSESCPIILSMHKEKEKLFEEIDENRKIGTTNRGIGPCYEDKVGRRAIRLCDLENEDTLSDRIASLLNYHNSIRNGIGVSLVKKEDIVQEIKDIKEGILPYVKPVWKVLNELVQKGKRIIFEGAQGVFLDVDHGTYPFVTSSNTVAVQAMIGSGLSINSSLHILGVVKAYTTRVGNGPFPTEQKNEIGENLFSMGNEVGTVSNRKRRCGWFDAVLVRQAAKISCISSIVLTKLDVLDSFDTIKVCTGYKYRNIVYDYLPAANKIQDNLEPIYEELPGWKENTRSKRSTGELPINLKRYIKRIEELIEVPVSLISTSPEREDIAINNDCFNM